MGNLDKSNTFLKDHIPPLFKQIDEVKMTLPTFETRIAKIESIVISRWNQDEEEA